MNPEYLRYGWENLWHRKLRSGLTVISILIGITAIFALVSFGFGIQSYVDEIAKEAGIDKLFIQARGVGAPGTDSNFAITKDDTDFISKVNGVSQISGVYLNAVQVSRDRKSKFVFGVGLDVKELRLIEESYSVKVIEGRNFRKGDDDKVILGYNYRLFDKVFERPVVLGEKLGINGEEFEAIGFYEEIGNPADDANAYMTYEGFEKIFPKSKDRYGYAIIRAQAGVAASDLADVITERLRRHKNLEKGKEDFFVQTFEDALATFTNIIAILNGMLFLIAFISVVVASVNTMNTMYTAVIERTKEIGVMKAIGARNSDIMFIFIFEAGLIGMIGGVLGVLLGFLIASAGGAIAQASGFGALQPIFPFALIALCIIFATFVGALSGILPARQAAQLRPVEALRYE